jgi:cytochrome c oxidase assembly protein subunit 15
MVALAIWIILREPRKYVGRIATCALLLIVLQGMLGGLTVLLLLPPAVSVAHACLAQAFFCLTVTLAVVTGPRWESLDALHGAGSREAGGPRPGLFTLAALLTGAIYLQLILGAVMRHMGAGLAIPDFPLSFGRLVPSLDVPTVAIHFAHRAWALVVTSLAIWTSARVLTRRRGEPLLARPVLLMISLLAAQITLGALTVWTRKAVLPTTAHVACGAALLATSLVLSLRSRRLPERRASRGIISPAVSTEPIGSRAGLA